MKLDFDKFGSDKRGSAYRVEKYFHPRGNELWIERDYISWIPWKELRESFNLIECRLLEVEGVERVDRISDPVFGRDWIGIKVTQDGRVTTDTLKRRINWALCISGDSFECASNFKSWLEENGE